MQIVARGIDLQAGIANQVDEDGRDVILPDGEDHGNGLEDGPIRESGRSPRLARPVSTGMARAAAGTEHGPAPCPADPDLLACRVYRSCPPNSLPRSHYTRTSHQLPAPRRCAGGSGTRWVRWAWHTSRPSFARVLVDQGAILRRALKHCAPELMGRVATSPRRTYWAAPEGALEEVSRALKNKRG
jgi:hypothetical protein